MRSSVARHPGLDIGALKPKDRYVEGIVEVTLDATRHFIRPLTAKRLFAWQAALFRQVRAASIKSQPGRGVETAPVPCR